HGRGTQHRLAERHHREFEREAARFVHADLHLLREGAEMRIARREFAVRVADADDRPAVELVVRDALALEPAAIGEAVAVLATEPLLRAEVLGFFHPHILTYDDWMIDLLLAPKLSPLYSEQLIR